MTDPVTYAFNGIALIGAGAVLVCVICLFGLAMIERNRKAQAKAQGAERD